MSFGFSITDIVHAAQIAKKINDIWFTRHNSADIHYIEFGRDVAGFQNLLERFNEAFIEYAHVRQIQLGVRNYHGWSEKTAREKREQEDQVGGFRDTAEQCEELLEENGKYLKKRANVWDNAKWHIFGGQERADKLRARIQFHSTKIGVFMQTISVSVQAATLNALGDIKLQIQQVPRRVLQEILAGLSGRPQKAGLRPIPPELHNRYMAALERDKPEAFIDVTCFPLKEGLDALATALDQSTLKFHGGGLGIWKPSIQQLHNLMKARWIFDRMRESSELIEAGPDSLWRWCLENVQLQLETEYAKYEHHIISAEADIASLDLESFRIWMPLLENTTVSITEADESQLEEKILEASLASSLHSRKQLIVFRRPENELRLVTITTSNAPSNAEAFASPQQSQKESRVVNMHQVQVVPWYALPGHERIIELCFPGASTGYKYEFEIDRDLLNFQNALLGYKVVHERQNCKWAFHRSLSLRTEKTSGVGRVQIWQAKPLLPTTIAATPTLSDTDTIGPLSPRGNSPHSSTPIPWSNSNRHSRTDSIHSNSTFSTVRPRPTMPLPHTDQTSSNVVTMQRPILPLLILFTELNKKPTYLVLTLDNSIQINHSSCNCSTKEHLSCTRTVLEANPPKRDKFSIRALSASGSAKKNTSLPEWNLALFSHPRHPSVDTVDKLEKVRWLSIDTPTPAERQSFQTGFGKMAAFRNYAQKEFEYHLRMIQRRAEKPSVGKTKALAVPPSSVYAPSTRGSVFYGNEAGAGLGIGLSPGSLRSSRSVRSGSNAGGSVSPTTDLAQERAEERNKELGHIDWALPTRRPLSDDFDEPWDFEKGRDGEGGTARARPRVEKRDSKMANTIDEHLHEDGPEGRAKDLDSTSRLRTPPLAAPFCPVQSQLPNTGSTVARAMALHQHR